MAEVASFRLRGWPAAVVGVGVVAWTAWGFVRHLQPVPAGARDAVQAWLVEDYRLPDLHHRLSGFGNIGTHVQGDQVVIVPANVDPADTAQVAIDALDAHGWKDLVITRARLTVLRSGSAPVHTERYLDLMRTPNGAWKVTSESSAWNYWYALVPAPRNGSSWP